MEQTPAKYRAYSWHGHPTYHGPVDQPHICLYSPAVDGQNPFRTTQEALNGLIPVNTHKQWFQPWFLGWCEMDFANVHSMKL